MMRTLFILLIISANAVYAQEFNITDIRLSEKYSPEEIEQIKSNTPAKYAAMDYYYSKSFEIVKDKKYNYDLIKKFDVSKHEALRKKDEKLKITDEQTGLTVVLFSLKEVNAFYSKYKNTPESDNEIRIKKQKPDL